MVAKDYIKKYLQKKMTMQTATANGNQPWVCSVFYVADDNQNLYWLSFPSRRHSQEITKNKKAAIAIVVRADWPVIGIQSEGIISVVQEEKVVKKIMQSYVDKYGKGSDFYDNFVAGTNEHWLYRFTPKQFVLFDEKHFSGKPRQVVNL